MRNYTDAYRNLEPAGTQQTIKRRESNASISQREKRTRNSCFVFSVALLRLRAKMKEARGLVNRPSAHAVSSRNSRALCAVIIYPGVTIHSRSVQLFVAAKEFKEPEFFFTICKNIYRDTVVSIFLNISSKINCEVEITIQS